MLTKKTYNKNLDFYVYVKFWIFKNDYKVVKLLKVLHSNFMIHGLKFLLWQNTNDYKNYISKKSNLINY